MLKSDFWYIVLSVLSDLLSTVLYVIKKGHTLESSGLAKLMQNVDTNDNIVKSFSLADH